MDRGYYIFSSGFCFANNKYIENGNKSKQVKHYALWSIFKEPDGYTVFDTGYAYRHYELTKKFPYSLYNKFTKAIIEEGKSAIDILKAKGIEEKEVKRVIISHFHGDHIGGLIDFPNAEFWCTKEAYNHIKNFPDYFAVSKGYLKKLIPADFEDRVFFIEDELEKTENSQFKKSWKWKFSNAHLHYLPGHARGQIGIHLLDNNIFFVADGAWTTNAFRNKSYPHPMVRLLADNWSELKDTIDRLHHFSKKNPNVDLVPTHCHEVLEREELGIELF